MSDEIHSIIRENMVQIIVKIISEKISKVAFFSSPIFWIAALIIKFGFNNKACSEESIDYIMLFYCILEMLVFSTELNKKYRRQQREQEEQQRQYNPKRCPCIFVNLQILGIVWYAFGLYYLSADTFCKQSNPHMWNMLFAIIIQKSLYYFTKISLHMMTLFCTTFIVFCFYGLMIDVICVILIGITTSQQGQSEEWKDYLKAIPFSQTHYNNIEDEESSRCSICLESFSANTPVRVLPCSKEIPHIFCGECIDKWFLINHSCPYCRTLYTKETWQIFKNQNLSFNAPPLSLNPTTIPTNDNADMGLHIILIQQNKEQAPAIELQ